MHIWQGMNKFHPNPTNRLCRQCTSNYIGNLPERGEWTGTVGLHDQSITTATRYHRYRRPAILRMILHHFLCLGLPGSASVLRNHRTNGSPISPSPSAIRSPDNRPRASTAPGQHGARIEYSRSARCPISMALGQHSSRSALHLDTQAHPCNHPIFWPEKPSGRMRSKLHRSRVGPIQSLHGTPTALAGRHWPNLHGPKPTPGAQAQPGTWRRTHTFRHGVIAKAIGHSPIVSCNQGIGNWCIYKQWLAWLVATVGSVGTTKHDRQENRLERHIEDN